MTRHPYQRLPRRSFINGRYRTVREVLLPLLVGVTLGYVFGLIITSDDIDSVDNLEKIEHDVAESTLFFLRCLILVHPEAKKPENFITAIRDTYGSVCNQTIYFVHSTEVQTKVADQIVVVVDSSSNAFYWNYYKDILVDTSEVPAPWTYIGDEQSFLVIGNLRKLVRSYNHRHAVMFGRIFMQRPILSYVFPLLQRERMSVQSGVVMSASAIKNISKCNKYFLPRASEKALILCAKEYGIRIVDPIDQEGMHLFNEKDIKTIIPQTYEAELSHKKKVVSSCCSDHTITFGQMSYKEIRLAGFASMKWKVFGSGGVEEVNASYAIHPKLFHNRRTTHMSPNLTVKKNSRNQDHEDLDLSV